MNITLYIDDTSIRLLTTSGKQIKKWAYVDLDPGLIEGGVVLKEADTAAKIKKLFKDKKVSGNKIILGLSGLLCLTRLVELPDLPQDMIFEGVMREAKRALPLPVEQLYISWQSINSEDGKTKAFLVAVRRKTIDSIMKTLLLAGLKPYHVDLKPLALARLVNERAAVIVDSQHTEFDIIITVDGIPHPIRTVPFPSGASTIEEKLKSIKNELDRTIKFYNSNNKDKNLAPSVPLFVSGELINQPELCQSLSLELERPVLPLPSPLESTEEFNPSQYMANIGLAVTDLPVDAMVGSSIIKVNALPVTVRPNKPRKRSEYAMPAVAAILTALLVPLVIFLQGATADIASIKSQLTDTNDAITQALSEKQELTQSIANLEEEILTTEETLDILVGARTSLENQDRTINGDLRETTSELPSSVSLSSVNHSGGKLTITGVSPSETDILLYAGFLDSSGRFSKTTISSISETSDGKMSFTLILETKGA